MHYRNLKYNAHDLYWSEILQGGEGGRRGRAQLRYEGERFIVHPQIFTVGQLIRNPCVIRAKYITPVKVVKKNRGLQ